MANKKKFNNRKKVQKVVDENYKEVKEQEELKPNLETGNYVITVVSSGAILKKFVATESEIYIEKLADGGLTVDLK